MELILLQLRQVRTIYSNRILAGQNYNVVENISKLIIFTFTRIHFKSLVELQLHAILCRISSICLFQFSQSKYRFSSLLVPNSYLISFLFVIILIFRYFQGIPEAVSETGQGGGCACWIAVYALADISSTVGRLNFLLYLLLVVIYSHFFVPSVC